MTKQQIIDFVDRISGSKGWIPVVFHKGKSKDKIHAYIYRNTPEVIHIHYPGFNKYTYDEQREILMHEIGHVMTVQNCKSQTEEEFKAQIWGMNKARRLGMYKVVRRLKKTMRDWLKMDWCTGDRKYIMAAMLAREKKII